MRLVVGETVKRLISAADGAAAIQPTRSPEACARHICALISLENTQPGGFGPSWALAGLTIC
jgi:hypothetical protein